MQNQIWIASKNKKIIIFMVILRGIKAACKWLNNADREITARGNLFYDSKTNELLAEVKLKDEDGNKYQ